METNNISKTKLIAQYKKEAARIYEDDKFLVLYPQTYNSMCLYGYGATWCITSSDEYLYESYNRNPLFVIIVKNSMFKGYQEKYLCQFETHGIVDNQTEEVGYSDFFNKYKILAKVFKDIIFNDAYKVYSNFEKEHFTNYILNTHTPTQQSANLFD